MKLKHYFQHYQTQIREVESDLEELIFRSMVSKILSSLGVTYPAKAFPDSTMDINNLLRHFCRNSGNGIEVPYILQNLTAGPGEYLKYYFLDVFTNQLYTDLLINMVTHMYKKHEINFIFDFSLENFMEGSGSPRLYVEYARTSTGYAITSIIYQNPFNGEMDMADFQSILLDSFYILNPEQCLSYLTLKIAAGVSTIVYSRESKEIELHPSYIGSIDKFASNSQALNYRESGGLENCFRAIPDILHSAQGDFMTLNTPNGATKLHTGYMRTILI